MFICGSDYETIHRLSKLSYMSDLQKKNKGSEPLWMAASMRRLITAEHSFLEPNQFSVESRDLISGSMMWSSGGPAHVIIHDQQVVLELSIIPAIGCHVSVNGLIHIIAVSTNDGYVPTVWSTLLRYQRMTAMRCAHIATSWSLRDCCDVSTSYKA
jgi:hypothetical protein